MNSKKIALRFRQALLGTFLLPMALTLPGCHSYHVEATVENRTGSEIKLLEVEYPSASFGTNSLPNGNSFPYEIQFRNTGPLKVRYTAADGHLVQIDGPTLAERQEGTLSIVLMPGGKAEFHPHLTPAP